MPTISSQSLLRILPRTHYDFGALKDAVIRIPIAQHIDVLGYERATLQVRLYSGALPAKSSLEIHLADDGFSPDDPANAFLQTKRVSGEEIGTLQVGDRNAFPLYQSISTAIPGILGRLMAVLVSFKGGANGGPSVVMSLDLVLTGGSVGSTIYQPSTYLGYAHEQVEQAEHFERLTLDQPDQTVVLEEGVGTQLSRAIREALLRGNLDMETTDGGYARFGNVNVGVGAKIYDQSQQPVIRAGGIATPLSTAIREALVRGNLDMKTPDGGYARFGNVNVGIAGRVRPDVGDSDNIAAEERVRSTTEPKD